MQWEFILALVLAIPTILFPAAFVWYLNIGSIYAAIKEARERKAAREIGVKTTVKTGQHLAAAVAKAQPVKKKTVEPDSTQ